MATTPVDRVRGAWAQSDVAALAGAVVQVGLVAVLVAVLVAGGTSAGTLLEGWRVAALVLLFGVAAVAYRYAFGVADAEGRADEARRGDAAERGDVADRSDATGYATDVRFLAFLAGAAITLQVLVQSSTPGIPFGVDRPLALAAFGLALLAVLVGAPRGRGIEGSQWLVVGAFGVVAAIFCYHTLAVSPSARASRWPLWAVVTGGASLLLVPRFVPARGFFWALAGLSAIVATLGAAAVALGEFSLWAFEVQVVSGGSGTRAWTGLPRTRSIFGNPNALGLVTFGGVTAAAVELHRAARRRRWLLATLAAGLGGIGAVGLVLSHSRASWLAAAVAVGCYVGYVVLGRWSVPYVTVAGALAAVATVVAVALGLLGIGDGTGRIGLWRASLRAAAESPSLLGEGHVSTSRLIEPYLDREGSNTTHNSYLSILLRMGILGALAYLALVLGTIADGLRRRRTVDLGALSLAVGWAVHQLFEAYTVVQWTLPAVLAALSLGYVAFGRGEVGAAEPETVRAADAEAGRSADAEAERTASAGAAPASDGGVDRSAREDEREPTSDEDGSETTSTGESATTEEESGTTSTDESDATSVQDGEGEEDGEGKEGGEGEEDGEESGTAAADDAGPPSYEGR